MPRYPTFSARSGRIGGSVYETYRARMAERGSDLVGLHIGDSHAQPPYELPLDARFRGTHPDFNRYCDTFGVPELRDALVARLRDDNGLAVTRDSVLVTAGATNALSATMQCLVEAGDEVLLLAPYWPFIRGMVRVAGGETVEIPFYTRLRDGSASTVDALLAAHVTPRTVAVYLNTPNNPSGVVLTRDEIAAVVAFARRHDLWIVSDEAYDGMTYDGRAHVSVATLDGAEERTISVFTFSKVFMFAGLRLGYAVAPADIIRTLNKVMVHQLYSPSTLAQQMVVEPVRTRASWARGFVHECRYTRDEVARALRFAAPLPEGAYYFFFPIDAYLRGRAYDDVIGACLDAGVAVAPGADFGSDYASYIRICFAGVAPERVLAGVERLNSVLVPR